MTHSKQNNGTTIASTVVQGKV